jgi:hypothetical protein
MLGIATLTIVASSSAMNCAITRIASTVPLPVPSTAGRVPVTERSDGDVLAAETEADGDGWTATWGWSSSSCRPFRRGEPARYQRYRFSAARSRAHITLRSARATSGSDSRIGVKFHVARKTVVTSVSVVTVAERASPSISEISPK